jgi:hypothetical protein
MPTTRSSKFKSFVVVAAISAGLSFGATGALAQGAPTSGQPPIKLEAWQNRRLERLKIIKAPHAERGAFSSVRPDADEF